MIGTQPAANSVVDVTTVGAEGLWAPVGARH